MRGYFSIGVERISKAMNAGNLIRSAHAFGASSFFMLEPFFDETGIGHADTAASHGHLPVYTYPSVDELKLPVGCQLVGIELTDDAIPLPSFKHPTRAAYILGPEKGSLSAPVQERCAFIVQIPMKFCVNVGVAGAIVMYDRMLTVGRHAPRPVRAGGPTETVKPHKHGGRFVRRKANPSPSPSPADQPKDQNKTETTSEPAAVITDPVSE